MSARRDLRKELAELKHRIAEAARRAAEDGVRAEELSARVRAFEDAPRERSRKRNSP